MLIRFVKSHNRTILLILAVVMTFLYVPINRSVGGGYILVTPLDAWIPLLPGFVFPYVFALAWWVFCFTWGYLRMEEQRWQEFALALIFCLLVAELIYILFPTYVIRPVIQGDDLASQWLKRVYDLDRPYNVFPSSHTFTSVLIFLVWREWKPRLTWVWGLICLTIVVSILFVHQHYLVDCLGGIALAAGALALVKRWRRGSSHAP
jgi:membrane-associated phospholipid phosphatase